MTIISSLVTETATETGHPATTSAGIPIDSDSSVATMPTADRVKLPKISLPISMGKWAAFWDSFNSAIHTNDRLSEIDKFNYLSSLLQGTAYDAIAGLALSSVNYQEAVTIL